jgi:mono/diheme cytochrome c family protein
MKRISVSILATAAASVLMLASCNKDKAGAPAMGDSSKTAVSASAVSAERGKYLVMVGGCNDCHTPWKMGEKGPAPDMTKELSGHPESMMMPPPPPMPMPWMLAGAATMTAWSGPWGISYTRNLTPDMETGIGKWDEATFIKTLRTGIKPEGKPIMPPMPWESIGKMTDDDLKSVFAYLKTIPAIKNKVPDNQPPMGGAMGGPGAPPPAPPAKKK